MAVECKEQCKKCFHFQVCASVLKNDLFIREVMLGEQEPKCKEFVEVVRCKDCNHFTPCEEKEGVSWTGFCNYGEFHTDEDDFCSRGERKDNERKAD